ncbi:1-phosphofructokinase family hexose kinase [Williamsia sterculiae]|uniref:1-phosphofructokinase n=1 Tax=Williamsia sterculiae TaxID=1344003 RepID=A0A1N7EEN4_9NOCA|nr:1-phosphofructokinase family hexose kinase [Williamsia sterculiae]SIR86365.1 1-phosphofructokinase [Williamsia sterculiae]
MIVTVTANPSMDRTVALPGPLTRGSVIRALSSRQEPGGKGVNVSRAVHLAGASTLAVVPARPGDPLLVALAATGLPVDAVTVSDEVRSNVTVTEPDGTTTKLNLLGAGIGPDELGVLTRTVLTHARTADWVAVCGSLPPGVPVDWYREVLTALRDVDCRTALDTSDRPLAEVAAGFPDSSPDLLKPNAHELAGLVGVNGDDLENAAAQGDPGPALAAAGELARLSGSCVLATLGSAGALLLTGSGSWYASPPSIVPLSTVGAGDSSLAGYLIAAARDAPPAECLRTAVAYGAAAAALPGTQPPTTAQLRLADVAVVELTPGAA